MKLLKLVPDDTNIDFVAWRKWAFGLTLALSIIAIALVGVRGLNMGVDFVGGLSIEERFPNPPSLDPDPSLLPRSRSALFAVASAAGLGTYECGGDLDACELAHLVS